MPLLLQKKRKHGGTTTEKLGESSSKTKKVKFKADPKRSTYADEQSTKKKAGGKVAMKKKMMMAGGGMMKKGYKSGGKLKMVEKDGKMVPFYAADGKGKMAAGGTVEKRGKKKDDKKKAAKGDRGFQGRAAARDLAKFKEKRGRIGGASRGAAGGAMGGAGGMGVRLMDAIGAPRPRRMKEGGMAGISKADIGKMLEGGKSMRATKKAREDAKRRAEDLRERIKTGKRKSNPATPMKAGGMAKKGYASGGRVSARGDGIARKGKTRGRMV